MHTKPYRLRPTAYFFTLAGLPACLLLALVGCSKDDEGPEMVTLEGKIESIERSTDRTGTITVRYYHEKHQQEMLGTGRVTEETEVLINGVAGTLADLREGDHARGDVRIEKKGSQRIQTAIRIRVDRAQAAP